MFRQGQRNLQEGAGPDEVVSEVRPQRIAPRGRARDVASALAKQRVIEQGHDRAGRGQRVQHAAERDAPQSIPVQTLAFKQTIRGRPVAELLPRSAKQAGQRVTAQTGQGGKAQGARPLESALLREGRTSLLEQHIPTGHYALPRLVFFCAAAGALRRRRSKRVLSSTIHSTTSPRLNSMAWATAEGKLMYHC